MPTKFVFTFFAIFFLFAFARAHAPLYQSDHENSQSTTSLADLEDATKHVIPETPPHSNVNTIPVSLNKQAPLVGFHLINLHFHMQRPSYFRYVHDDCRLHHLHKHPWKLEKHFGHMPKIYYSNDMTPSDQKSTSDLPMVRAGIKQIPASWALHHQRHHGDDKMWRFSFRHHNLLDRERLMRHYGHCKKEIEPRYPAKEREDGGFFHRFRKFLNGF